MFPESSTIPVTVTLFPDIFQYPEEDKHAGSDSLYFQFLAKSTCCSKYDYIAKASGSLQSSLYWSCLFIIYIYIFFFPKWMQLWFINAARRPFNNKYADRVKVFGDILFLPGENVSLEEIRISAILMTKQVCCLKNLMKSEIFTNYKEPYNPSSDIKTLICKTLEDRN